VGVPRQAVLTKNFKKVELAGLTFCRFSSKILTRALKSATFQMLFNNKRKSSNAKKPSLGFGTRCIG
jgi:hypothetical protein